MENKNLLVDVVFLVLGTTPVHVVHDELVSECVPLLGVKKRLFVGSRDDLDE